MVADIARLQDAPQRANAGILMYVRTNAAFGLRRPASWIVVSACENLSTRASVVVIDDRAVPQPRTDAGVATAEAGLVLLDGPDGVALTLTPQAAALTGQSLIDAAAEAERQARADPEDTPSD
jgi:hypothetical protein